MGKLLQFVIITNCFCGGLSAQYASSYCSLTQSGSPPAFDGFLTLSGGNMGSCTHTYTDSLTLSGPGGRYGNNNFNNSSFSSQAAFTDTWNDLLTANPDGEYSLQASTSAFCSCINEPFYSDTCTYTEYPQPYITSLSDANYQPFLPAVDTPQSANLNLVIWGNYLTANGASNPPSICLNGVCSMPGTASAITVTGFHLGSGWYVGETDSNGQSQINIPAWIDASATTGTYTLTLTTAGGNTSAKFSVGDATPVITGVSPSSFTVGVLANGVQVTGQHLGTVCPNLSSFPFGLQAGYSISNCTDSGFNLSFTPSGTGSGPITLTDNGYGNGFNPMPGQKQTAQTPTIVASAPPTFTVAYSAWIPVDHEAGPSSCLYANINTSLIYKGDANRGTYRATESLLTTPQAHSDSGFFADTGTTFQYGYGSPFFPPNLTSTDDDGRFNDCYLENAKGKAGTNTLQHDTSYPYPSQAQVHYNGTAANPLEAQWASISWDMRVVIDASNPATPTAYVNYNHTCYPSHQITVGGKLIYSYIPTQNDIMYITKCLAQIGKIIGQTSSVSVPAQ